MLHRRVERSLLVMLSLALWMGSGCTDKAAEEPRSREAAMQQTSGRTASGGDGSSVSVKGEGAGIGLPKERPLPPAPRYVARLSGQVDLQNHYPSVVLVNSRFPGPAGEVGCSGALVSPRLVLTAGHCVCSPHKSEVLKGEVSTVIDGSGCAAGVTVTTVIYEPSTQAEELAYVNKEYKGRILLHPEFKVELDSQDRVVSSHADLAAILLEQPVESVLRPLSVGAVEVGINESLGIVGYGDDGTGSGIRGQRRINKIRVAGTATPPGDRIALEPPKQQTETDDSGGPCLREDAQGATLAGISNRRLGKEPTCTSIYPYRTWVRDEIQRASQMEPVRSP